MVKNPKTRVARIAKLLNEYKVEYVIVGGEACNVHGVVRGTKDVDVLLKKDRANVEKALAALSLLTFSIAKEISPEEVLSKPLTIIGDSPRVDLLFCSGKLKFEEAAQHIWEVNIESIPIPFVDLEALIKSKETDRMKDLADLEILRAIYQKQGSNIKK